MHIYGKVIGMLKDFGRIYIYILYVYSIHKGLKVKKALFPSISDMNWYSIFFSTWLSITFTK